MDQWWRFWDRTGHRWIEKSYMNVFIAIRERMLSWVGHVARMDCKEISAKALRCRWRWRQFHLKESKKDKCSVPHPQRLKNHRWEDMVAGEIAKFTGNACDFSESVKESTGWFQNRKRWMQFAKCGKSFVLMVPGASGTHVHQAWLGRMQVLLGSCGVEWFSLISNVDHGPDSGRHGEKSTV